jgi:hypothetical protein
VLRHAPGRHRFARLRARLLLLALLPIAMLGIAVTRDDLARSPYGPVASDILERLHALEATCDMAIDPGTRCFTIAPGTVAHAAEMLEGALVEYGGTLTRSPWRSANGVYYVAVWLLDDVWGALELWLTEPDGQTVAGRIMYVPKRRNGLP